MQRARIGGLRPSLPRASRQRQHDGEGERARGQRQCDAHRRQQFAATTPANIPRSAKGIRSPPGVPSPLEAVRQPRQGEAEHEVDRSREHVDERGLEVEVTRLRAQNMISGAAIAETMAVSLSSPMP